MIRNVCRAGQPLRGLGEVAYLRFASVYQAFTSADDFEKDISRRGPARSRRMVPDVGTSRLQDKSM